MLQKRKAPTSNLGKLAENYSVKLLISRGYRVLERNFRSRFGEIDIVAVDGKTLVFVEVKARWSVKFGSPEEAVTKSKLKKIIKTAEFYVQTHPNVPQKMRIDVVALEILGNRLTSVKILKVD